MKNTKSIETKELLLKGNIMSWEGTMIQLSNVSCVSTIPLEMLSFPRFSILLLVLGFFMITKSSTMAFLLIAGGCGWIYAWYHINEERKRDTILSISMNSGDNLRFVFSKKSFLDEVLHVLEKIIGEGGVGEQNVSINIHGCKITGNAKILNDLNL